MLYLDTVIKLVLGLGALLAVTRHLGKKEMGNSPRLILFMPILGALLEESLYDDKNIDLANGFWRSCLRYVNL